MRGDDAAGDVRPLTLFSGPCRLDACLHTPSGAPEGALVMGHPHPAHGGHMDHPVVRVAAERAAARGLLALRFDVRGVRGSEGRVEDVLGHLEDVRSAARELRRRLPDRLLLGGGFSYGARLAARAVRADTPDPPPFGGLLLIAPATRVPRRARDFGNLLLGRPLQDAPLDPEAARSLRGLPVPTEVIVGSRDVVAPVAELEGLLAEAPAARLEVLEGLNHFFSRETGAGRTARAPLARAVDEALRRLLA